MDADTAAHTKMVDTNKTPVWIGWTSHNNNDADTCVIEITRDQLVEWMVLLDAHSQALLKEAEDYDVKGKDNLADQTLTRYRRVRMEWRTLQVVLENTPLPGT